MEIPTIPTVKAPYIFDSKIQYIHDGIGHNLTLPNIHPPVTVQLGFPIVDIPGCVEVHPDNENKVTKLPFDKNLVNDDPKGTTTICPNGQYPTYNAINYEPDQRLPHMAASGRKYPPPPPPAAGTPDTSKVGDKPVECPGPNAPRIGDVAQNQKEKVSGFELSEDGKICIILYEDINIVEQYLPPAQVVVTTGGIAAVAATSALLAKPLADLILKSLKPVIKQVITKVKAKLGISTIKPSRAEIKANEYRAKKGLLPLKKIKKKK